MDILILGNGFDLAHGLKTRYVDFLNYCLDNENIENVWLKHFINKQQKLGDKWIDLEEEIYNVIRTINENLKSLTNNYEKECISKMYMSHKNFIDERFDLGMIYKEFKSPEGTLSTDEKGFKEIKYTNDLSSGDLWIESIKFSDDSQVKF
ncbi:MAG: bacteriophage abortive infection AbiH family protein [bacterium]|nr:bacteriophage abortive infection AbiH family protein [bacterium]